MTSKNYEKSKAYNFSGCGFSKKTSQQIVAEIKAGFLESQKFIIDNYQEFVDDFSLERVLPKILNFKQPKRNKVLDPAYANSVERAEILAINYFRNGAALWYQYKDLQRLELEVQQLCDEKAHLIFELDEIRSSRGYKLLSKAARVKEWGTRRDRGGKLAS